MGASTYTLTQSADAIIFGKEIIKAGAPPKTVDGQTVSFGPQGLVIDEGQPIASTFPVVPPGATLPPNLGGAAGNGPNAGANAAAAPTGAAPAPPGTEGVILVLGDAAFTYLQGAPDFQLAQTKISKGGPAATAGQSVVSLGPKGVVVDGKEIDPIPLTALPPGVSPPVQNGGGGGGTGGGTGGGNGEGTGPAAPSAGSAQNLEKGPTSAAEGLHINLALVGAGIVAGVFALLLV